MASVWAELGYDDTLLSLAESMRESTDVINLISGAPGIGKSYLARGIGALWERAGGRAIVAEGDRLRGDSAYYALGFAMAGLSAGWRSSTSPVAQVASASESAIGTAGVVTATVQAIAQLRPKVRRARTMFLGDSEQEILFELERLAGSKPLLLIADNLHWWDHASVAFLGRMREGRMRQAFSFLAEMRVVAVRTVEPYQHASFPEAVDALLEPATTREVNLPRVPREGFENVLAALGASEQPSTEVSSAVYSLTGGHLALAARCAERLALGESEVFVAAHDSAEFVEKLLTERIRSLGSFGDEAVQLLRIAAVIGQRFRRDEVACAWTGDEHDVSRLLRFLREQDIFELSEEAGWFVHDLYRQYFLETGSFDRVAIHERLIDCLRQLSPADYDLRSQNAVRAERPREAAALAVQAGLARLREGASWRDVSPAALDAIVSGGMEPIAEQFSVAVDHLDHDRHAQCLAAVAALPHELPVALLAEADYIRGAALNATRSLRDRARARSILDAWSGFEEEEPELGIRLMQMHLNALSLMRDKEPGRLLERRMKDSLRRRVNYDRASLDAMYTLDRCSQSLYEPEVSLIRTREATAYYGPDEGQQVVRRPIEYYRCLVNLAADLVMNGRYAEAREVSAVLDRFVDGYTAGVFPRMDHPTSTSLLADYRLGLVDAPEATRRQRDIVERHGAEGDPFYTKNSLGVYLALSGDFDEALALYDRLLIELDTRSDPELSMVYVLRANRCAVRFVAGERDEAARGWADLWDVLDQNPYTIRPILIRRHELLAEVMERGEAMSPLEFDECLVVGRRPEFGPLWDQLGRGFRTPEIMWWY